MRNRVTLNLYICAADYFCRLDWEFNWQFYKYSLQLLKEFKEIKFKLLNI